MNQTINIILLILVTFFYISTKREDFINFKKSCIVVKPKFIHSSFKPKIYKLNDDIDITSKDYGIRRNHPHRFYSKYYKTSSIEHDDLEEIVQEIVAMYKNKDKLEFKSITNTKNINYIRLFILDNINKKVKEHLKDKDIVILNDYKIINTEIIYTGENNLYNNYQFIFTLFRFGTHLYYNVYFDVIVHKLKNTILFNSAKFMGTKIDNLVISEEYNKCVISKDKCVVNDDNCSVDCNNIIGFDPDYKKKMDMFIKMVNRENTLLNEENNYNCYKKTDDGFTIDSKIKSKTICLDNNGVWDRPCLSNSECPFYNKTNNTGKCNTGNCQFPWGIEVYSPRTYNKESVPFCSGCSNGTYRCCKTQNPPKYIFKE